MIEPVEMTQIAYSIYVIHQPLFPNQQFRNVLLFHTVIARLKSLTRGQMIEPVERTHIEVPIHDLVPYTVKIALLTWPNLRLFYISNLRRYTYDSLTRAKQ